MSYTKRHIEELTKDPFEISDEQFDAEYRDFLRSEELDKTKK